MKLVKRGIKQYNDEKKQDKSLASEEKGFSLDNDITRLQAETERFQHESKALQESIAKYDSGLSIYMVARKTQLEQIEGDINNSINKKESEIKQHDLQRPGFFSTKKTQQSHILAKIKLQAQLAELQKEKKKLLFIKQDTNIIKEYRENNPEITKERDFVQDYVTKQENEKKDRERQSDQKKMINKALGIDRTLERIRNFSR